MTTEDNGNVNLFKPQSSSNEDLSEYTDADESISAPTEFLAEFLSAVMLKDYVTALKYCKLILHYEPNNATAKEFYPLILAKLKHMNDNTGNINGNNASGDASSDGDDDNDDENPSSSSSSNSTSDSDSSSSDTSSDSSEDGEDDEDQAVDEEEGAGKNSDKQSKGSTDGDATTGSYSSLEDDEADNDPLAALAAKYQIDNVNLGNGNKIFTDTTDKLVVNSSKLTNHILSGNPLPFGTSSDSESPTEPVSQQTVQMVNMFRTRVVPIKH